MNGTRCSASAFLHENNIDPFSDRVDEPYGPCAEHVILGESAFAHLSRDKWISAHCAREGLRFSSAWGILATLVIQTFEVGV